MPEQAEPLYEAFCGALEDEGIDVARGVFGARMEVQLANDGPVTIILETAWLEPPQDTGGMARQ